MYKSLFAPAVSAIVALSLLAGCGAKPAAPAADTAPTGAAKAITLKVGVTAGPHEQIMKEVAKTLAKDNITLDIKVFTDYKIPNQALNDKDLDVNSFQHRPYLDQEVKDRGYKLTWLADTVTFPMAVYSKKIKKLDEIKDGGTIAIPNDATNGGRALLMLQSSGLIKLKPGATATASPRDIAENPKKIKFQEVDASLLPRMLPDVDAAAINTNFAMGAGLHPGKDGIFSEKSSPYANGLVVRTADKDQAWAQKLVAAYRSAETKQFIATTFNGDVVANW